MVYNLLVLKIVLGVVKVLTHFRTALELLLKREQTRGGTVATVLTIRC